MESNVYFIENLILRAWLMQIWPRLLRDRMNGRARPVHCYVVDGSRLAMLLARFSARMFGFAVEKLVFRLIDIRDENGLLMRLRIPHKDLPEVQRLELGEPQYQKLFDSGQLPDSLPIFLSKNIAVADAAGPDAVWRTLLLIHACIWKMNQGNSGGTPVLFLERRAWCSTISRYASGYGVIIIPVFPALRVRAILRRRLPPRIVEWLRACHLAFSRSGLFSSLQRSFFQKPASSHLAIPEAHHTEDTGHVGKGYRPRVAVDTLGQINLNEPELHSDLAFWQRSSLEGKDLMAIFSSQFYPADEQIWSQLAEHDIAGVALNPGATTIPSVPVFRPCQRFERGQAGAVTTIADGIESPWIRQQISEYSRLREYWTELFRAHNLKVYVTWYKYDAKHCAIGDALRELGGITAIYQRGYEGNASAEHTLSTDIVFAFSPAGAERERLAGSIIQYHVATGYMGDHRFPLLRVTSRSMRDRMQSRGAKRIIAFFDEGSGDDPRWHTGHDLVRENYAFLLEKVLAEPWLGLLIKPKVPRTLRRRLGAVAELLERAEATGRCYVYESGAGHASHAPAEAALAADMAIHGHLNAATAGLEAALGGVPTLLLDREGWSVSPLYKLGPGKVVFTDWEELWGACLHHWAAPDGTSGIGDWSPMLDEFDPFRDGRASERMGTYLKWLIDGFRDGQDREAVMADAAERYCALWGSDKINAVRGNGAVLWAPNESLDGRHTGLASV